MKLANNAKNELIPETSRKRYETAYSNFRKWQNKNNVHPDLFSEDVFLGYFMDLSKNKKASTLWSTYSMLKAMIELKHQVHIVKYTSLAALLKAKWKNYSPKKSYVLEEYRISEFINKAPDEICLASKVRIY